MDGVTLLYAITALLAIAMIVADQRYRIFPRDPKTRQD
jgi:hypothetical protein